MPPGSLPARRPNFRTWLVVPSPVKDRDDDTASSEYSPAYGNLKFTMIVKNRANVRVRVTFR